MLDVDKAIELWSSWKHKLDDIEARRTTGQKNHTIEWRVMVQAGTILMSSKLQDDREELVYCVDRVFHRIRQWYPEEMKAIEVFYKRGKKFRAVRIELDCSQHMSRRLVERGQHLIRGGLASTVGFESLEDRE